MKRSLFFLSFFALVLLVSGCTQSAPPEDHSEVVVEKEPARAATADDFIGDWQVTGGDFEEITLDNQSTFYTFLHERPFDFGVWEFATGTLLLRSDAGHEYIFTDIHIQEGVLSLQSESSSITWIPIITE